MKKMGQNNGSGIKMALNLWLEARIQHRNTFKMPTENYFLLNELLGKSKDIFWCVCVCVCVCVLSYFSRVWLFAILWTIAHQTPLFMEFSRQEYWIGLPFPIPGNLPHPEIKPASLTFPLLAGTLFPTSTTGKPIFWYIEHQKGTFHTFFFKTSEDC